MKIIKTSFFLLVLFTLSIPCKSFSQEYVPLPDKNASWSEYVYTQTGPNTIEIWPYFLIVGSDTTINSSIYKKVYYNVWDTLINSDAEYVGAFRDDTLNKKAFVVPKDSIGEALLYDFTKTTGDTIYRSIGWNEFYVIDSIGYITIENTQHKKYFLFSQHFGPIHWIEGVGSSQGFIYPALDNGTLGSINYLNCLIKNGNEYYHNDDSHFDYCFLYTDINESTGATTINIYPNPNSGNFYLQIDDVEELEFIIECYTMEGQVLFMETINLKTDRKYSFINKINGRGAYFLVIKNENTILKTQKIVVQ